MAPGGPSAAPSCEGLGYRDTPHLRAASSPQSQTEPSDVGFLLFLLFRLAFLEDLSNLEPVSWSIAFLLFPLNVFFTVVSVSPAPKALKCL